MTKKDRLSKYDSKISPEIRNILKARMEVDFYLNHLIEETGRAGLQDYGIDMRDIWLPSLRKAVKEFQIAILELGKKTFNGGECIRVQELIDSIEKENNNVG